MFYFGLFRSLNQSNFLFSNFWSLVVKLRNNKAVSFTGYVYMNGDIGKLNSGAAFAGAVPDQSGAALQGPPGTTPAPHHHHSHDYNLTATAGPSAVSILSSSLEFFTVFFFGHYSRRPSP